MENSKCSIHSELFAYYCIEDAACICASCHMAEEHRGHQMETLDEASEKKKQKLRKLLQALNEKNEEFEKTEERLQSGRKTDAEKVALLLSDMWKQLEHIERSGMSSISCREEQASVSVSGLNKQLAVKTDELSKKTGRLEELCNMTNPLTMLQEPDFYDTEEREVELRGYLEKQVLGNETDRYDYLQMNEALRGISDSIRGINVDFLLSLRTQWSVDLDKGTAANNLQISENMRTASHSELNPNLPEIPGRFRDYPQVLSVQSCSSGRHYWKISLRDTSNWGVGMCYPSIDRAGEGSVIGSNQKSWCVRKINCEVSAKHGGESALLHNFDTDKKTMKMYLNYEAGQLSFYEEGDWFIQHLHTFTATFTEPLHLVLFVGSGAVSIGSAVTIGAKK